MAHRGRNVVVKDCNKIKNISVAIAGIYRERKNQKETQRKPQTILTVMKCVSFMSIVTTPVIIMPVKVITPRHVTCSPHTFLPAQNE
jgi:hypothetical protein